MDRLITVLLCAAAMLRPGSSLLATNKLALASWGSYDQREHKGLGTYSYGYDIEDPVTGNVQFKHEERHPNGTVTGIYGYVDGNGKTQVTNYVSDVNGYRVFTGKKPEHFTGPPPAQLGDVPALPIRQLFYPTGGSHTQGNGVTTAVFQPHEPNRVHNPPPVLYQLQGPPVLTYYRANIPPMPFLFKRKRIYW